MTDQKYIHTVICLFICSIFHTISADEACDKSKCPGPLAYYESLGCTPIHSTDDDCCAVKYNCDHLKTRSKDKCYIRDHVYEIGEPLREEDADPCDIGCTCTQGYDGIAGFSCAIVDCFSGVTRPGCYRKNSPSSCCPGEEVCPEGGDAARPRCVVDGKTYLDGQYFSVESDPTLNCVCAEGYTGENVSPFCEHSKSGCNVELRQPGDIYNKCAPVYYSNQHPATSCSVFSRCQNSNDTVVKSEGRENTSDSDPDSTCTFGNMTMQRGEELNSATDYSSVCVKCVCEVPPMPTCQRLPDDECDVTAHPAFNNA